VAGKLGICYKCISYPAAYYYALFRLNINDIVKIRAKVSENVPALSLSKCPFCPVFSSLSCRNSCVSKLL